MSKTIKIPGRLESAETGNVVAGANTILDDTKGKKQNVINQETDAELLRLDREKQGNLTFDQTPMENSTNPVTSGGVYAADQLLSQAIEAILLLIPSAASELNKLVDLATMNSSISTATASFKGTFNLVSDLHLTVSATHAQIAAALDALSLGADNNDYAFVQVPNTDLAPTDIKKTERYKFNGTNWAYEYDLNNSGFTSAQWAAINSNITAVLVSKLSALPTNEALTALLAAKQDNLTFDDAPTSGSNNPVKSGGIYTRNNEIIAMITALDAAKQDVLTFDITPTENSTNPVTSNGVYQAIYLVQAALAALDGRMLSAEHSIELLTEDVGVLRTLYQALSQSDIIVGALPATGVANTVYRVPGTSTYADWMYYNGAWVKLAEYTTLDGYLYKGIATPTGSPAASAVKMFYFALTAGTYTNFGGLTVKEGISILKYDGANWTQDKISYMDGGVFDVTAYSGSEFTSLSALLSDANLNNLIPTAVRKGGMSIKFVESSDHKYVRYNLLADSFTTDITQWAIDDGGVYVDNPEFVYVKTDANDRILWAIKKDGGIHYGAGVPQQVVEYIQQKINQYHGDDILTFLNGLEEGDKTLQDLLNERGEFIDNPEYIQAISDSENRVLEGIKTDGTKVFHGKVEILGSTNIQGVEYSLIQSPEWIRVVTDSHGAILCGIRIDGSIYINSLVEIPSIIQDAINSSIDKRMEPLEKKISAIESVFFFVDNPEYIAVEADKEGNVISGRNTDGSKFENFPVDFKDKVSIDGNDIENIQDIEGRTELKTDNKGKVISYRDSKGVLHEVAGIEPEHLYLPKDSLEQSYLYIKDHADYKNWYLPKFGKVNIKSEKFYLTADGWSDYSEDVILIQILDNTNAVARQLIPIAHFYIKSTLVELPGGGYDRTSVTEDSVKLDLYVPKDIQEVSGLYYVKKTLTKVTDPITGDVTYEVNANSIEVRQVTDIPPYMAWKVDKSPEHWCIADIDFREFYSKNNVAVGIKYQGRSTLAFAKRGFRLTFYKNATYAKKDKVKIGEMIRLSGYNMKAYANDYSLIKDPVISAIVIEMWKTLGVNCFPWDNASVPFNGATGTIKSFPIETWFADTFYGLQFFGYKKDEKNYMLDGDDDSSGVFAQGAADLGVNMNDPNPSMFNDEMGVDGRELAYPDNEDSVSVETAAAMENLFNRIKCLVNGSVVVGGETIEFSKEYFEECVDLKSWIDYWIVCEVFLLWDNLNNNIILYAGRDKMMYYAFFYDLDQSMNFPYNTNMVDRFNLGNGFWDKFRNEYKDFIINRYYELRKTVLSLNNINSVYKSIIRGIPESVNSMELSTYGNSVHKFDSYMEFLENRLSYLDNNYLYL